MTRSILCRGFVPAVLLGLLAMALVTGCAEDEETKGDAFVKLDGGPDTKVVIEQGADLTPDAPLTTYELIILHTNDMHAHLTGWGPIADYTSSTASDDSTVGGLARLATKIKSERTSAGSTPVLLLDAGDFLMGSMFDWLNTSTAPTMTLLQDMAYDAVTLGNHEFDWTPDGLAGMVSAAATAGFKVPIVASNLKFSSTSTKDDNLEKLVTGGVITKKLVKTLSGGLKVGLFGLIGPSSASVAHAATPVTFEAVATAATAVVKELRETDKVDLVICISHGGVSSSTTGDDITLAKAVTGIDVIVGGHSHTALTTPITEGKTVIVQAGDYGKYLGKLALKVQGSTVTVKSASLLTIDDKIAADSATQTKIDGWITAIDTALTGTGLTFKGTVATTAFDLTFPTFQETILGNVVTDAYKAITTLYQASSPPVIAFESGGVIRDPVLKGKTGNLWLADLYGALPLGIGPDQKPGYPLVTFYLTGKDLKNGMELLALAKGMLKSNDYFMQVSGMVVNIDSSKGLNNTVTSITIGGTTVDLTDTTTCYKAVTNYYVASLFSLVGKMTGNAVTPKQSDCSTAITDLTSVMVKDTSGNEVKHWQALVGYLGNLKSVPSTYSALQSRIVMK